MKKILLLIIGLFFALTNQAQVTIESNNCSSQGTYTWNNITQQTTAGGYWRIENDASYIISPAFNTSANPNNFTVKSKIQTFGGGSYPKVLVEVSNDNGLTWTAGSYTTTTITNAYITYTNNFGTINATQVKVRWTRVASSGTRKVRLDNIIIEGDIPLGPTITSTPISLSGFTYVEGGGSSIEQSFAVEGNTLTNDIDITPPTNWEISTTSGGPYQTTPITLTQIGGTVASTTIYTRMVAGLLNAASPFSGNMVCTSTSATTQNIIVDGTVTLPEVNFTITTVSVQENSTTYNIDLISNIIGSHTVDIILNGGIAINGTQYVFSSPITANFIGATTFSTSLTLTDNATCDGNTNIIFSLNNNTACTIGTNNQLVIEIDDDEMDSGELLAARFEGADTWAYVSGGFINTTANKFNGSASYRLETAGKTIEFADVNILGFTDVAISVAYASKGPDSAEDLFMDISYDGGTTYSVTKKLIDGGGTGNTVDINSLAGGNTPQGANPYIFNVPPAKTSVRVKFRSGPIDNLEYYYIDDVILTRNVCNVCSEPTFNGSFVANSPQSITKTSATIDWVNGNGTNRIVVLKEATPITFLPVDNTTYISNTAFGSGIDIGTGEYTIYNGSLTSVNVTNLTPGTEYFTSIYEYGCTSGFEDYLITGSIALDTFISKPETPSNINKICINNTSIDLAWAAPTGNISGYLLVAREGGGNPSTITSLDMNANLNENLDYSLAAIYGATNSRILYKGPLTAVTVSGLTQGISYAYKLYAYASNGTIFEVSTGTGTSAVSELINVTLADAVPGNTLLNISWVNPNSSCFDEILVVVNETAGIGFSPVGNGTSYTANSIYAGINSIVYKGTGSNFQISGLTNFTTYYIEIFVRQGTNWSNGVEISSIPTTAIVLEPGDLAIVAVNTNDTNNKDEVCFFAFKDITEFTAIDFTDNGFERATAGTWGDTEGTMRLKRISGGTISKGTVICFVGIGNSSADFDIYVCGVLDNANWTISSLNGSTYSFNMNGNDQIWILQNGAWQNPTGTQNATYSGNLLFGWTATPWKTTPGYNSTAGSTLPVGTECISTDLTGITTPDKGKYTGDTTIVRQRAWLNRINNVTNWTGYATNATYDAGNYDYKNTCIKFRFINSGFAPGQWEGDIDDNWFECSNWQNLVVPNESVDVVIQNVATNNVNFNHSNTAANIYNGVANCHDLTIESPRIVEGLSNLDTLKIHGNLLIEDNSILDLNGITTGAVLEIKGNFTNNDPDSDAFDNDKSLVIFSGNQQQEVNTAHSSNKEIFYDVQLKKGLRTLVNLNDSIEIANNLILESGIIKSNTNEVIVTNGATSAISGYEAPNTTGAYINDRYVEGNLTREIITFAAYEFPVGDVSSGIGYNPVVLDVLSGTGQATAKFVAANPGTISVNETTLNCMSVPVLIHYTTMTGLGYWNFESTSTFGYNIMLHPNSLNTNTAPNLDGQYRALKAPSGTAGGTWPSASGTNGDFCVVSNTYYAIPGEGYNGFSDFGIGGGTSGPALPVKLLYFDASVTENNVTTTWATATEINNDFFTVEQSKDGFTFNEIGMVKGSGNSQNVLNYHFIDKNPLNGLSYYRLKQTDFDGTISYSAIKAVSFKAKSVEIGNIYPNPVAEELYIPLSINKPTSVSISIIDLLGRNVINKQVLNIEQASIFKINTSNLASGTYHLLIETNGITSKKLFIKQ